MAKDKQIEIPESEMGMSGYSKFSWELWERGLCTMCEAVQADRIMREQGYRKASEVAREIFEEIEKVFGVDLWLGSTPWKYADYERLKKKYTEDKK